MTSGTEQGGRPIESQAEKRDGWAKSRDTNSLVSSIDSYTGSSCPDLSPTQFHPSFDPAGEHSPSRSQTPASEALPRSTNLLSEPLPCPCHPFLHRPSAQLAKRATYVERLLAELLKWQSTSRVQSKVGALSEKAPPCPNPDLQVRPPKGTSSKQGARFIPGLAPAARRWVRPPHSSRDQEPSVEGTVRAITCLTGIDARSAGAQPPEMSVLLAALWLVATAHSAPPRCASTLRLSDPRSVRRCC